MKLNNKNFVVSLIIIVVIIEVINPFKIIALSKLNNLNYSIESSKKILEYGLKNDILEDGYIEFINKNILLEDFDINHYDIYKSIDYSVSFNDINIINKLINKGYNAEEINCISKRYDEPIDVLLVNNKYEDILEFLKFDYANIANLERYTSYQKENSYSYEDTVIQVEIGLDNEYYSNYAIVNDFAYDMLVNKYNKLNSDFIPKDLVLVKNKYSYEKNQYGNRTMLDSFYKMADDLNKELGLKIYIRSGYRTYDDQNDTYNHYLKNNGKDYTEKYVAHPGFSEHQTGLAIDIKASSGNIFEKTKEAKWVSENAYKYGFIERYSKNNEDITGYQFEKWHYRYVGTDISTYIHENNISFDEYYVKFIK